MNTNELKSAPLEHLLLISESVPEAAVIRTLALRMEEMEKAHEEALEEAEKRADEWAEESEKKDDLIRGCHGTLEAILYSDLMNDVPETLSNALYKLLEDLNN